MTSRADAGTIFLGVTPRPMRAYLLERFRQARGTYKRLLLPCVGRFTDAETAVAAGWEPERIETSDISLFSSLIGFRASGKEVGQLGVRFDHELADFAQYVGTEYETAAVLLGLKLCQLRPKTSYDAQIINEIRVNLPIYMEQLKADSDALVHKLSGIKYEQRDVLDHWSEAINDPECCCYVSPPGYAGGYAKMFETHGNIAWNEPKIPEFDYKAGRPRIYDMTLQAKGLAFVQAAWDMTDYVGDKIVFYWEGKSHGEYLACNRADEQPQVRIFRKQTNIRPAKIPLLPVDYEITEASKVAIVQTKREHALYYRDLFAHKLGVTRSESYYFILIDGYIFGVFGMFFDKITRGQLPQVSETFGFNVHSNRYPRLNRLLMTILVSKDTAAYFKTMIPSALLEIEHFQTTCIASVPEVKANRGLLDIVERYQRPDKRWYINYRAAFREWTWQEGLARWLNDQRRQQKATGKDLGVAA